MIGALRASIILGVSTGTVYNWAKKGKLPSFRSGRRWLFKQEDVEALHNELSPVPFVAKVETETPIEEALA